MTRAEFGRLLNGSIRYELKNGVLTITGYYTGETVSLDLTMLSEEAFEDMECEYDG